jgi:hypothetical protein
MRVDPLETRTPSLSYFIRLPFDQDSMAHSVPLHIYDNSSQDMHKYTAPALPIGEEKDILLGVGSVPNELILPTSLIVLRYGLVSDQVTHAAMRRMIIRARHNDTALCYDMNKTFARGQLISKEHRWQPTVAHAAFLNAVARDFNLDFMAVWQFDGSVHSKRCKATTVNPENPEVDLLLFSHHMEGGCWYDITRTDSPHGKPTKRVAGGMLVINDTTDPRFQLTCTYCSNRRRQRLASCSQCCKVFYCDGDCQLADWKVHRKECKQ